MKEGALMKIEQKIVLLVLIPFITLIAVTIISGLFEPTVVTYCKSSIVLDRRIGAENELIIAADVAGDVIIETITPDEYYSMEIGDQVFYCEVVGKYTGFRLRHLFSTEAIHQ